MKIAASLAVVAILLASLAGCTSTPAAKPTPLTAAQKCTPGTATIQWGLSDALVDPDHVTSTPVRVNILDYSIGNGGSVTTSVNVGPAADIIWDDEVTLVFASSATTARWKAALLKGVRLTGQVPTDFGAKETLPVENTTVHARHGKFLDVDQETLATVPFTITCAGEKPMEGSVVGTIPGAWTSIVLGCGDKAGKHDSASEKQAYAIAPRYCSAAGQ